MLQKGQVFNQTKSMYQRNNANDEGNLKVMLHGW